jgi:hypothetical protein
MPTFGFMIVLQDNMSNNYSLGIPDKGHIEQVVYTSYKEAKAAIEACAKEFNTFIPVAYGRAFPYEALTFEGLLETESFAPYGWAVMESDEETYRVAVGLFRVRIN